MNKSKKLLKQLRNKMKVGPNGVNMQVTGTELVTWIEAVDKLLERPNVKRNYNGHKNSSR